VMQERECPCGREKAHECSVVGVILYTARVDNLSLL
jgi:hypothetical protein